MKRYDYIANGFVCHNTGRYSNAKTRFNRLTINVTKTGKVNIKFKDSSILPNMQGLSGRPYITKPAKQLKSIPISIEQDITSLNDKVEELFREEILKL